MVEDQDDEPLIHHNLAVQPASLLTDARSNLLSKGQIHTPIRFCWEMSQNQKNGTVARSIRQCNEHPDTTEETGLAKPTTEILGVTQPLHSQFLRAWWSWVYDPLGP